jgi:outer membrane protein TolC
VRRLSLDAAQRLLDENRTKRATGVLTDLDVLTAEVGVSTQQRNVLLAEQQVRDQEDALRALIGQFELDAPVAIDDLAEPSSAPLAVDEVFAHAKAAQPEYLSLQAGLAQLRLDVLTARNARLPELDFNGAVGYSDQRPDLSGSVGHVFGDNGYNWQMGLSVTYPWRRRGETARYHIATNALARETARLHQSEQDLLVQVRSAVRAVATNRNALQAAALGAVLSQKQFELQKARFDAGLATSRLVLDAQADLDNARVNELSSKVALLQSFADLRRLEGRTLEAYQVSVTQ